MHHNSLSRVAVNCRLISSAGVLTRIGRLGKHRADGAGWQVLVCTVSACW